MQYSESAIFLLQIAECLFGLVKWPTDRVPTWDTVATTSICLIYWEGEGGDDGQEVVLLSHEPRCDVTKNFKAPRHEVEADGDNISVGSVLLTLSYSSILLFNVRNNEFPDLRPRCSSRAPAGGPWSCSSPVEPERNRRSLKVATKMDVSYFGLWKL